MQVRRSTKLLVEPSAVTTGDIAFNLIVFFLVCASAAPDSGRRQDIPRSETAPQQKQKIQHVEVQLTRTTMAINGDVVRSRDFAPQLRRLLAGKPRPEDRVVVVQEPARGPLPSLDRGDRDDRGGRRDHHDPAGGRAGSTHPPVAMKIQRKAVRAEVPSTAMGDIAFNLLIFFVILARANDDSFLNWQPARAKNLEAAGYAKVSVLIDGDSKLYLNGRQVGMAQLSAQIGELLGDAPAGQRTVLLKIHREAQALYFEPVIEAVSEAGGDLVHVLEELKE